MNILMKKGKKMYYVIIPAGGKGLRMQMNRPKQMIKIDEYPIIYYTLNKFIPIKSIEKIIIPMEQSLQKELILFPGMDNEKIEFCQPGEQRQDSVMNGLKKIKDKKGYVLIHDSVRPFISNELIQTLMSEVQLKKAVIPVIPVKDTVKIVRGDVISSTPIRNSLFLAQTPQIFEIDLIYRALQEVNEKKMDVTDDASAVERFGHPVYVIPGEETNRKITTKEDLTFFQDKKHV